MTWKFRKLEAPQVIRDEGGSFEAGFQKRGGFKPPRAAEARTAEVRTAEVRTAEVRVAEVKSWCGKEPR